MDWAPLRSRPRLAPGRHAAWRRSVVRRVVAATLGAAAVLGTLASTRPPPVALSPVVLAAEDLPAGHRLVDSDLSVTSWPTEVTTAGGVGRDPRTVAEAVGSVLVGPIRRGEPVTTSRLVGTSLLAGQPPGTVAAYLPLQGAGVATMLGPGSTVDVIAPTGIVAVRSAVVLAVLGSSESTGGLLGGPAGSRPTADEPGVVLGLPAAAAATLTMLLDPDAGRTPAVVLVAR